MKINHRTHFIQAALGLGLGLLSSLAPSAFGRSAGLNNIPTADTPKPHELTIQAWTSVVHGGRPSWLLGARTGFSLTEALSWEVGFDSDVQERDAGPVVFQTKLAYQFFKDGPKAALGIANLGFTDDDNDRAGQPFAFAVLSHDFDIFRLHAGYGLQDSRSQPYFGIDRTWEILGKPFTLRGDLIKKPGMWVGSVGFWFPIVKYLSFESWVSKPFEGTRTELVANFNIHIPF